MAVTPVSIAKFPGFWIIKDTDPDSSVEKDVCSGPCTLCHVSMLGNGTEKNYLKFWDDINPTVGTTPPDEQYPVPKDTTKRGFPINPPNGLYFENGLSFAMVQQPGTAGTTDPSSGELELVVIPGSQ